MRVAISGSRGPDHMRNRPIGWSDYDLIARLVERLLRRGHTINVGDAPSGVDYFVRIAHETEPWADEFSSDTLKVYEARWGIEGKRAGHNRNAWMVGESDMLIALYAPTDPTPGTTDAIKCAEKKGIPILIYYGLTRKWEFRNDDEVRFNNGG